MNISSIVDIVQGELINSPSISSVYNIKSNSNKVLEGDLFIAKNENDLKKSIKNGAFAIIFDFEIEVTDNEIAWIKVESTYDALIKLFRYKFSTLDIDVLLSKKTTYSFLKTFTKSNKNIKFIDRNIFDYTNLLEYIHENKTIISFDKDLLEKIYPKYKKFENNNYNIDNLIEHSLFETSFSYNHTFFNRLKIPSLYINDFLDVYFYLNKDMDLKKVINYEYFKPIFIDKFINIIDFGKSNKFILCNKDIKIALNEINYLFSKYKYGKNIIITNKKFENLEFNHYCIDEISNLRDFLLNKDFNSLYIIGFDTNFIENILNKYSHKELELF